MEPTNAEMADISNGDEPALRERTILIAVQVRPGRPLVHLACGSQRVRKGDFVVFMTEQGKTVGEVLSAPISVDLPREHLPPKIEGPATIEERERHFSNLQWEQEAKEVCHRLIKALGLPMKLIDVETFFDRGKTIFYYVSEGRVDFRELVRELVKALRGRVEMRQVSSRHATKRLGGIGSCGLPLCCATFLGAFEPISIKMAKVQNLSLNPAKITGVCGRLLCCLAYEYDNYLHPEPVQEPVPSPAPSLPEVPPAPETKKDEAEEAVVPLKQPEEPDTMDIPHHKRPRKRRKKARREREKGKPAASKKDQGARKGRKGGPNPPSLPPTSSERT